VHGRQVPGEGQAPRGGKGKAERTGARGRMSRQQGWVALLANVVVRRAGEAEVHAATADPHDRYARATPARATSGLGTGSPPRTRARGPSSVLSPQASSFGPTTVRFDPHVKCFDGNGFADLLSSRSACRTLLWRRPRAPLGALPDRTRTAMGGRAPLRHLSVLRARQRAGWRRESRRASRAYPAPTPVAAQPQCRSTQPARTHGPPRRAVRAPPTPSATTRSWTRFLSPSVLAPSPRGSLTSHAGAGSVGAWS